ncbi:hypothetical protein CEXT_114421 [Caerostris extrusa]|uniref:Uncharacterized protein n=1 Tax=Caerostris extrusa TaxID=172846 RepID=A0AAV4W1K7_CAEEX|nr:hypothetical protein CEXT_114421 [Caerostris extrusa]
MATGKHLHQAILPNQSSRKAPFLTKLRPHLRGNLLHERKLLCHRSASNLERHLARQCFRQTIEGRLNGGMNWVDRCHGDGGKHLHQAIMSNQSSRKAPFLHKIEAAFKRKFVTREKIAPRSSVTDPLRISEDTWLAIVSGRRSREGLME